MAALGDELAETGDRGRRGGLAEDPLEAGEVAVGRQDLVVGDRLDASAGLVAGPPRPRATRPGRRCGWRSPPSPVRSTGWPSTMGAAPAAWKPSMTGRVLDQVRPPR